ncbi:hypothetical protein F0562_000917 [Nyssa sinensis]|uniref:C2H2-type domain-containing protein n=1 Tax=Nyssa sinensis TaxID=561372 RepID=A0A5J5C1G3_9ASTE|nr:hypothetical protein F0562_000917 [Nyssa sinensis]
MAMKSGRQDGEVEKLAVANCLILLSRVRDNDAASSRVFECKTCNRQFQSFQALGGHRTSHKRPKRIAADHDLLNQNQPSDSPPKTHECSICGVEFAIGQALGGHMRRHRNVMSYEGSMRRHSEEAAPVTKKTSSDYIYFLFQSGAKIECTLDTISNFSLPQTYPSLRNRRRYRVTGNFIGFPSKTDRPYKSSRFIEGNVGFAFHLRGLNSE